MQKTVIKYKYMALAASAFILSLVACSDKKNEDMDLNGVWFSETEVKNQNTGESRFEKVVLEFKGSEFAQHRTKTRSDDIEDVDSVQTEQGSYKKVNKTLEMEVISSSCAGIVDEKTGEVVNLGSKNKKIAYEVSEDKSSLTLTTLNKKIIFQKLSETHSENVAALVSEAQKGCFIVENGNQLFKQNEVKTILEPEVKSDLDIDEKL